MSNIESMIERHKIIAILRNVPRESLQRVLEALYAGGVRMAEITLNSDGALEGIAAMRKAFEGRMTMGAGTVMHREDAQQAIEAGAEFLISPHVDEAVIEMALQNAVLPLPGALTPTEVVRATRAGASMVKLFPCSSLGSDYVKELNGPLNKIKLIAVGGITQNNAAEYIRAGVVGVGVGSSLVSIQDLREHNYESITNKAEQLNKQLIGV
jgi:2-dehydro-3-deoxyphosphogluconate aldolase/(4S)-4-hydroxy-2-oxoglutarate aldolase